MYINCINGDSWLDKARCLQRLICTSLSHRLQTLGGDVDGDLLPKLGDEQRFLLEIDLAAAFARGIEFGRTRSIRIPPAHLGFLSCYVAYSRHTWWHCIAVATKSQKSVIVVSWI